MIRIEGPKSKEELDAERDARDGKRRAFAEKTAAVAGRISRDDLPEAAMLLAGLLDDDDMLDAVGPSELASCLLACDGPGPLPDCLLAYIVDLYGMAIEAGDHRAMCDLGAVYYRGDRGIGQDFGKAVHYYQMAAAHGSRQAYLNLGYCYYYGRDMEPDYEKAFRCFAMGAFEGMPASLYKIGDMYLNGYYVRRDEREAFRIYSHCLEIMDDGSREIASGPVHLRLGDMYLEGTGTDRDPEQALRHYHEAEIMLYRMIMNGDHMYKKSLQRAIEGQSKARSLLADLLPGDEWTLD